ncbi:M15 family metallopeptidase [uncultured Ruminococcus sp.]|uniref:M15 family metallopeptidase n=1 Tax=uncultured Ruminococcus sp. TaxID=165186 RepID=UPI0025E419D5|nr:M15 family metallopeptidase [uncultured Ruminococcus sp.]
MNYLILVDKFNNVPVEYADTLKFYEVQGKLFEEQAGKQLERMLTAADSENIKIKVISGYRSPDYQQMLWERSISLEMWSGASYDEAIKKISRTLAYPGSSEHNTGLAVDLGTESADDVEDNFHRSAQGRWLSLNAEKFGFILRYPRMKEQITGIDFEPWHYRYVGREAAKIISSSGLCLEEFLHFYSDKYLMR